MYDTACRTKEGRSAKFCMNQIESQRAHGNSFEEIAYKCLRTEYLKHAYREIQAHNIALLS